MNIDDSLFVIEGASEVGKTTLAHRLAESLSEEDLSCRVVAFPGNSTGTLGNLVKRVHENPSSFVSETRRDVVIFHIIGLFLVKLV
jgi:thymidylate kinase